MLKMFTDETGKTYKIFRSADYNYDFCLNNGEFKRWGATFEDDPSYSKYGPEILDIEVSTICNMGCKFCYKSNTGKGTNMSFETFKQILDTFPKYNGIHFLNQIAFGIGDIDANPDLWNMMIYCRDNHIVPNITINGARLTDDIVHMLVKLCGAVSVSCYDDKNVCYDAVKRLQNAGMKQVNIHSMISEETAQATAGVLADTMFDDRLERLNAVVMLSLKQKGRGERFNPISNEKFKTLVVTALNNNIRIGFDSCGCNKFLDVAKEIGRYEEFLPYAEPCESCSFSSYIDTDGKFFPCSFASECTTGLDVTKVVDFKTEVWDNGSTVAERKRINDNNRSCPYFNV